VKDFFVQSGFVRGGNIENVRSRGVVKMRPFTKALKSSVALRPEEQHRVTG
jgi:hypothetical protein